MRFHEWTSQYEAARRAGDVPPSMDSAEYTKACVDSFKPQPKIDRETHAAVFLLDEAWREARRPYYSIWPGIADAFLRMKLDVPARILAPPMQDPLLVRFSADSPPSVQAKVEATGGLQAFLMLVDHRKQAEDEWSLLVLCGRFRGANDAVFPCVLRLPSGDTIEDLLTDPTAHRSGSNYLQREDIWKSEQRNEAMCRVAVAVCLLGQDPAFLEPDVLDADKRKWYDTKDLRYVDKAHRRGKVGWMVGRGTEVNPHHRRRHLAIRWTEKGRAVPRLVWVKSCIVKRRNALAVPEGYLG